MFHISNEGLDCCESSVPLVAYFLSLLGENAPQPNAGREHLVAIEKSKAVLVKLASTNLEEFSQAILMHVSCALFGSPHMGLR